MVCEKPGSHIRAIYRSSIPPSSSDQGPSPRPLVRYLWSCKGDGTFGAEPVLRPRMSHSPHFAPDGDVPAAPASITSRQDELGTSRIGARLSGKDDVGNRFRCSPNISLETRRRRSRALLNVRMVASEGLASLDAVGNGRPVDDGRYESG